MTQYKAANSVLIVRIEMRVRIAVLLHARGRVRRWMLHDYLQETLV